MDTCSLQEGFRFSFDEAVFFENKLIDSLAVAVDRMS